MRGLCRGERTLSLSHALTRLSLLETCGFLMAVALPTCSKGVIIRRQAAVALAAGLDLDRRAVRHIARLRAHRGAGPLVLGLPGRLEALVLDPGDVRRVLEQTPDPFSPASSEKRAALAHFEPHTSLISEGPERVARRRLQDAALESDTPTHSLAPQFAPFISAAAQRLAGADPLDWRTFSAVWMRLVREVVLGRAAAGDEELTRLLNALRGDANWAFMKPKRKRLRSEFHRRLQAHLERAEPGSLAARVASLVTASSADQPTDQMAQWLFAFEPAGIATFRALAVLATHPQVLERALADIRQGAGDHAYLRACIVDSVRLWPTTPAILRQARRRTSWPGGELPQGAGFLIFTPFLHRDRERLPVADRFAPEQWIGRDPAENGALTPFSAGPAKCPARHLAPMLGAALLADLLRGSKVRLCRGAKLEPEQRLPATLNHFALAFRLSEGGSSGE